MDDFQSRNKNILVKKSEFTPRLLARSKEDIIVKKSVKSLKNILFPLVETKKTQKLISSNMQFQTNVANLNQFPGLFVIGVLGRESSGKTTILQAFNSQRKHHRSRSYTTGVDMDFTCDGLLLLDTQPILRDTRKGQAVGEIDRKLSLFILSTCHLVFVVTDHEKDSELFTFVNDMTKLLPDVTKVLANVKKSKETNICTTWEKYKVPLVAVLNRCSMEDNFTSKLTTFKSVITSIFIGNDNIAPNTLKTQNIPLNNASDSIPNSIACYLLPKYESWTESMIENDDMLAWELTVRHSQALDELISNVKSYPRISSSNKKSIFSFTEREWFRFAGKIWDTLNMMQELNKKASG
jgi:hypothetical protein